MENNYISELEYAEVNLQDDIQALGYLIDEYFGFSNPTDTFKYQYHELQNRINLLFKSMVYNHDEIKKTVDKYYEKRKEVKE